MSNKQDFVFTKQNYLLLFAGIALIVLGYLLMMGGAAKTPDEFNTEELFSFRRITLAPVLCVVGLITVIFAIMKRPKQ